MFPFLVFYRSHTTSSSNLVRGANYHIVTHGDGRRPLFHDAGHYEPKRV